ncbi:hypothetical protein PENTCL1PPCAC_4145, partial [Pristionchus entomophagus]
AGRREGVRTRSFYLKREKGGRDSRGRASDRAGRAWIARRRASHCSSVTGRFSSARGRRT